MAGQTYGRPSVTINAQGPSQSISTGPNPTVLAMVGRAPKGPTMALCDPITAQQLYGNPSSPTTQGYDLPYAAAIAAGQRPVVRGNPIRLLMIRIGTANASAAVLDQTGGSPLTAFTISGIGVYAGTAGSNLRISITLSGSAVQTIQIDDYTNSGAPVTKQLYTAGAFDLTSNTAIQAAINGANDLLNPASVIQISPGNPNALLPKAVALQSFTGGSDGKTATAGDATIPNLLAQSLLFPVDAMWFGFNANTIESVAMAHIAAARAANNFRKLFVGPSLGNGYGTLIGGYNNYNADTAVLIGHEGVYGPDPISGTGKIYDGFMIAAALAGLKCQTTTEETTTGFAINGFSRLLLDSSLGRPYSDTEINALGNAGFLTLEQTFTHPQLTVVDGISSAQPFLNGQVNGFAQMSVRWIDDAVSEVVLAALTPYKGRPGGNALVQSGQIASAVRAGLGALGNTIGPINSVNVSLDPSTLFLTCNVSYTTRYPITTIIGNTQFTYL